MVVERDDVWIFFGGLDKRFAIARDDAETRSALAEAASMWHDEVEGSWART